MNDRPRDPTGSTAPDQIRDSGRAGLDDPGRGLDPDTGLGRPEGSEGGADARRQEGQGAVDGLDVTEREVVTSGTAATSEIADPTAQEAAGRRQGGPTQRRG